MNAAIYARYSSQNQRPESIDDQILSCCKKARECNWVVLDDHIYTDPAQSGASWDRPGLNRLVAAAGEHLFEVVLIDDLSRLARDNYFMLRVMLDLNFENVRVVSVADGVDTDDPNSTLNIQLRGVFNELNLRDLKAKTLRGQIGQKSRGYFVGENTYGYRSVAVGTVRYDKAGRPRPEGHTKEIDSAQAAVVLRIFERYAAGDSASAIVRGLNADAVPGRFRSRHGWSAGSVTRILDNAKYRGYWVWNRYGSRRDPHSGQRRHYEKPKSDWIIRDDESFRIVPQDLWEQVEARRREVRGVWPGGKGRRGFSSGQGGRVQCFPRPPALRGVGLR